MSVRTRSRGWESSLCQRRWRVVETQDDHHEEQEPPTFHGWSSSEAWEPLRAPVERDRAVESKSQITLLGVPEMHSAVGADHIDHSSRSKSGCITQSIAQFSSCWIRQTIPALRNLTTTLSGLPVTNRLTRRLR